MRGAPVRCTMSHHARAGVGWNKAVFTKDLVGWHTLCHVNVTMFSSGAERTKAADQSSDIIYGARLIGSNVADDRSAWTTESIEIRGGKGRGGRGGERVAELGCNTHRRAHQVSEGPLANQVDLVPYV